MKKRTFVQWPKLTVWHIERTDGHTVCGRRVGERPSRLRGTRALLTHAVCASCDRMADAVSVLLR